jgi:hypothetical protein
VPKVARAGQTEGGQAQGGARMRIRGNACPRKQAQKPGCARACQTEGALARESVRKPNGGRACQTDGAHAVFPAKFGVSKGSAHVPRVAHAGQSEGVQSQGDWRERMPKGAHAGLVEGAQARMSACVPNEGRACPRERGQAKRRAREPNEWRTCRFPCKIWVSKGRAHVPNGGRTSPR